MIIQNKEQVKKIARTNVVARCPIPGLQLVTPIDRA